ncbi:MAG: CpsD/CapB family tyrosine-protein kinase [Streptococcaceae bacterium]|jgi:capsular exopolysaccharide synthesis family protein|nr:CpsD/CapB family tyrosine-protein kinase [Streptococcaceae bacterium]
MVRNKKDNDDTTRPIISKINPKSPISEQYRTIRTNIEFAMVDNGLKSILMTSAEVGAGKSTLVANLAILFAEQGKRVLLIDADLRKPTVHRTFNLDNQSGLANVLVRQVELGSAIQETDFSKNLFILSSGSIPNNPSELLGSRAMADVLTEVRRVFDLIIVDTPPLLGVTDAQILSRAIDGVVLVAHANQTKKEELARAKRLLEQVQANILGCVLSNYEARDSSYYYYYGEEN